MANDDIKTSQICRVHRGTAEPHEKDAVWNGCWSFVFQKASLVLNDQDAEDVTQEVIKALSCDGLHKQWQPHGKGSFWKWLGKVAFNKAIDLKRKLRRDRENLRDAYEVVRAPFAPDSVKGLPRSSAQRWPEFPLPESGQLSPDILERLTDILRKASESAARQYGQPAVQQVQAVFEQQSWRFFLLFEFENVRAERIALIFGKNVGAVHKTVSRVRKTLKKAAAQRQHPE